MSTLLAVRRGEAYHVEGEVTYISWCRTVDRNRVGLSENKTWYYKLNGIKYIGVNELKRSREGGK